MTAHPDRDQLAPPSPPGRGRAVVLAVLVHAALIGALTWGVNWTPTAEQPAVVAELWSSVPQEAAPRAVEPPPPPPPPPEPAPRPAPPPKPPVAEPDPREAQIAVEKEKERKRLEQEKREREQKERERKERERAEKDKKERELKEREQKEREQKEREERRVAEQKKAEQERQKKQAEERRKAEEARRSEELRQEQLRRIQGLANATGGENARGTAERSSGPSGSYAGRVAARVKPNIVYPEVVSGNPRAEVEVRAAPDGTITGIRLTQSSGNKAWDDAVVRALQRTETLPRDVDGRVPSPLVIGFRPQD